MRFTIIFWQEIRENSSTYQQAASSGVPFYVALIWDSPRIKWAICVVFAEDSCWIVAGVFLTCNW